MSPALGGPGSGGGARETARRLAAWAASFPRPVWLLAAATAVESTGRFIVVPYLSLYLSGEGVSLGVIGLVLGAAPVAAVLFGALGGQLSDHWGRKPVQVVGVVTSGLALLGFALAGRNPLLLGLLNFLNGMTRTFYRPAVHAAIADFCPPERRAEGFALIRTALNAAFGWAPLLGVLVFTVSPRVGFLAGGALNLAAGTFLALAVPESAPEVLARRRAPAGSPAARAAGTTGKAGRAPVAGRRTASAHLAAWRAVLTDTGFLVWTAGLTLLWGAYDLIQSFLPLHLRARGLPLGLYALLLTVNALVCVLGQLPVSRALRLAPIGPVAAGSKLLFALGFLGFAWLGAPAALLAAMFVLSTGEILGAAVQVRFVPERSPPRLFGRYLGLGVLQELGRAILLPAAGFIMQTAGGEAVFAGAALVCLLGGGLLLWGARLPPPGGGAMLES